jgi:hypothetical protein
VKYEGLKVRGNLEIVLQDKTGKVKKKKKYKNLVVSTGLGFIVSRMKDSSEGAMSHIGLGSGTTAAASDQTGLVSDVGNRNAIGTPTLSGGSISYSAIFGVNEATGSLTEAGIFNASSAGTMLCRTVFPVINKQATDTMTVNWVITLSV